MSGRMPVLLALLAPLTLACPSGRKKAEDRTAARQAQLEKERAVRQAANAAPAAAPSTAQPEQWDSFWSDPAYVTLTPDGACPEGLWSLFPGPAPGDDPAQKKANEARRRELAEKLKGSTFVVRLRAGTDTLKVLDHDPVKGELPIEVKGVIDCKDSAGNVAIGLGAAKAITPGQSAAKQGSEVAMRVWDAPVVRYAYPLRSVSEAKEFLAQHRFDIEGRAVFRLGRAEVDKKLVKVSKATSGEISIGGGTEDWGAGRMVKAELLGVRIAADHGRKTLIEQKSK